MAMLSDLMKRFDYFIWRGPALQRSSAPTCRWSVVFVYSRPFVRKWERGRAIVTGTRRHLIMIGVDIAVKRAAHHVVGSNHVTMTYGSSHFTPPIHLPFSWRLAVWMRCGPPPIKQRTQASR